MKAGRRTSKRGGKKARERGGGGGKGMGMGGGGRERAWGERFFEFFELESGGDGDGC